MPRERQKRDKLTHAQIVRHSCNERKQEDPDGLREKEAAKGKRQYNKNKNNPKFKFKSQKS